MIMRRSSKVIVLGITGRQGTFWTEKMLAYGTQVVAGVNPKRAGGRHCDVPIFASTAQAVRDTGGDVAGMLSAGKPYATVATPKVMTLAQRFLKQLEPVFPGITKQWNGRATLSTPMIDPNLTMSSCR